MPLAHDVRPLTFDDMVGQEKLIGKNGTIRHLANIQSHTSCVFCGPPGCGKTTAALILAQSLNLPFVHLDATTASTKDIKDATADNDCVAVYLDEIQYFNKKQQQSLLSFVEDGSVVLIAATTENPYASVYKALLSRMHVFEFEPLTSDDIIRRIKQMSTLSNTFEEEALNVIAMSASGDMRRALNLFELANIHYDHSPITADEIRALIPQSNQAAFDMSEQVHSELKGALQKSIRGSDVDAAVFYLMRFLSAGDLITPMRRLLVIASEDIGLADPYALQHTLTCIEAAERLGLPEAKYPMTQLVVYLATAPKCNSLGKAFGQANRDIHDGLGLITPSHIAGECPKGYLYPHDYPNHWVDQQYLPSDLLDAQRHYWIPQDNEAEQLRYQKWQQSIGKISPKTTEEPKPEPEPDENISSGPPVFTGSI